MTRAQETSEVELPSSMFGRFVADQRVRFVFVGGVNTVVGYAVFAVLAHFVFDSLRFGYILSLVISYAVSLTLAFVLYRRLVFIVSGNVLRDFVRFVSVYMVSIAINLVALPLLVEAAGVPALIAQAIVLCVTVVVSFVGHKYFSFRRVSMTGEEAPQDPAHTDGHAT